jgi:hypothetical protein
VTWNHPLAVAKSEHEQSWLASQVLVVWRCKYFPLSAWLVWHQAPSTATAKLTEKDLRNMHKSGVQGLIPDLRLQFLRFSASVSHRVFDFPVIRR